MSIDKPNWKILVVDDDEDVLTSTLYTLMDLKVLGRGLDVTTLGTVSAAMELLQSERDFAVILLDVVMEKPHSGLGMISKIRQDLKMTMVRVILRTGQPGYANEEEVTLRLEIDDYILKQTAGRERIVTAVVTAIRAYNQLLKQERVKDAMEQIIVCSNLLLGADDIQSCAEICMKYIAPILGAGAGGALAYTTNVGDTGTSPLKVISATSDHGAVADSVGTTSFTNRLLATQQGILLAREFKKTIKIDDDSFIYIKGFQASEAVLWVQNPGGFDEIDDRLLEYFSSAIKACIARLEVIKERMEKAMLSMGILAHEFRTPIASMLMSNAFMLEATESNVVDASRFIALFKNTELVLNRMNKHIDSSMLNVGIALQDLLTLPVARVDIGMIVRDAIEINAASFSGAGKMQIHIEEGCWASADPTTFEHVFLNLMSNAIKALSITKQHAPGPQIEIDVYKQADQVILRISDRGPGIRADLLPKIYQPFFSSSGTPSHGLGLTMVKKSIAAMGGTIECTSVADVGTTFTITLNSHDPASGQGDSNEGVKKERRLERTEDDGTRKQV